VKEISILTEEITMCRFVRSVRNIVAVVVVVAVAALYAESAIAQGGTRVVVLSGKGMRTQSTSVSSSGSTGSCSTLRLVVVSAAISGGDMGNTITANARCQTPGPISSATATDDGNDATTGGEEFNYDADEVTPGSHTGQPRCERVYSEPTPAENSSWTVTCIFVFQ
jgi:hypothetical protein